jgi:hypothetical protein
MRPGMQSLGGSLMFEGAKGHPSLHISARIMPAQNVAKIVIAMRFTIEPLRCF